MRNLIRILINPRVVNIPCANLVSRSVAARCANVVFLILCISCSLGDFIVQSHRILRKWTFDFPRKVWWKILYEFLWKFNILSCGKKILKHVKTLQSHFYEWLLRFGRSEGAGAWCKSSLIIIDQRCIVYARGRAISYVLFFQRFHRVLGPLI